MAKPEFKTLTYVKKVGDQTFTREVNSPQAKVAAEYDGFTEKTTKSSSSSSSSTTSGSGRSASS